MLYKVIGVMSGSSLDGLDIAYVQLQETGGKWEHEIVAAECYAYPPDWKDKLTNAIHLSALEYLLLHCDYGHYIGRQLNKFIDENNLHHKVDLVTSHGHTVFHFPRQKMTGQIGDGAAIAAETQLPVVTDLRALDVALGGQGAPIVPIGEKLLFSDFNCFLNIGGIANISVNKEGKYIAFDICAANRVLNMLSEEINMPYDDGGKIAASGKTNESLLRQLNALEYYQQAWPKSLDNSFGVDIVYPLIKKSIVSTADALRTYIEHIAVQVSNVFPEDKNSAAQLLVTGGGALNIFLIDRLSNLLVDKGIKVIVPEEKLVQYKEALIMALIGVLRWREEPNVLASVTDAVQSSIGGALWLGKL